MFAEAATRHLLTWEHPSHLDFTPRNHLRKWYAELCGELDDAGRGPARAFAARAGFDVSFTRRPRVVWTHPDGPGRGLLLDRVYTASRAGVVDRDRWVAGKVASDLHDMANYLAPLDELDGPGAARRALLGVRVISHRAPNAGIHFTPAFTPVTDADGHHRDVPLIGAHHPIGDCQWCAPAARLPLATPTSTCIRVSDIASHVVDNNNDNNDESKRSSITNKNSSMKKSSVKTEKEKTEKKKPMKVGSEKVGVSLVKVQPADRPSHVDQPQLDDDLDQAMFNRAGEERVSA